MAKAKAVSAVDFNKQKHIIDSGDTTPGDSTELVRIIVTTTLSHVLWYRSVFPEVRYVFRTCDPADSGISYDAFMKGPKSGCMSSFEPTEEIRNWAILPRGQDPGADKLLNRLENGVKEALENRSLSKLQLSFHTVDEHSPSTENLLESYTLGFAYKDGISLAEITTEAQNTVLGRKTFTIGGIKTQMNYLLETMDYMIGTQDRARGAKKSSLPGSFRMLLTMKYFGGECYRPVGFHAGNEKHMALIEATALDTKLRMATGHHSVIAGILLPLVQLNQEPSQETPELLPVHPAKVPRRTTRSRLLQESSPGSETQSRIILEIESMGASRRDDFNTQLIQSSSQQRPQYSSHAVRQAQTPVGSIAYSQPVLDLVEQFLMQDHGMEMSQAGPNICECQAELRNAETQRLQPRAYSSQDNMIKCAVCDGHRHAECYGYLGSAPEVMVCYSCLKEHFPEQESQLEEVQRLCFKRRVLYYFFKNRSLTSMKDLTAYLNSTSKKVVEMLQQLKAEKYLEGSDRRKVAGKLFTFVGQEETAVDQYFNPCTGIESLLDVQPSIANIHRGVLTPELTSKPHQAFIAPKPSLKAPRVFHAIPGVSVIDDTSTQGSLSPQAQRTQDLSYVTPNRITAIDLDFESGFKRKQDTDSKNVKRARISIASPWTIIKE